MKKISIIFGTRPEAIKLIPVIIKLKEETNYEINICVTAQHREMLDQVLEVFNIVPDFDMNIMLKNQTLSKLTASLIDNLDQYFNSYKPDIAIVQGDTSTVLAVSLVAFYHMTPVAHVEAGLRTYNKYSPFPEELNRTITSKIADLHFAPTELSKGNLLKEGIDPKTIFVTGNTVIDALKIATNKVDELKPKIKNLNYINDITELSPYILITGHRRENFGESFNNICYAIAALAERYEKYNFIYPVHLNPNVQEPVKRILSDKSNVHLLEPLAYLEFVALLKDAYLVLTDSGGIQEEAPSLGKPVLVMRDTTERPEAVNSGTAKLVGTDKNEIVKNVSELIDNELAYNKMANSINPYGDGNSSSRIREIIINYFKSN